MTLWVAADALAGRHEPDATVSPQGRIEPGVTLTELERLGVWVRVETPDGQRWWVDGRRLDRPDEPPPLTTPPSPQSAGAPEDRRGFAMRSRTAVLVAVVAVAAIAVIGGAVLLFRGGATPPTIVRGRVDLGFEPQVVQSPTTSDLDLVVAGDGAVGTLSIAGPGEGDLWLTEHRTDGLVQAVAGGPGAPVLLSASAVVEYGADGENRTVALPADCCADVILRSGSWVVVFPEVGGVSRELWEISLDDGERVSYALPAPVEVTAVAEFDGSLYVGHTEGIMVLAPWFGCDEPLAMWDLPTDALTVAIDDPPMVAGLNAAGAIFTIDPLGPFEGVQGCTDGVRIPQLTGGVPLREAGLDARDFRETLAVVGDAAYVIDTDGVVYVVDLTRPDDDRDDRLIATIAVPEPRPGEGARLARLESPGSGSPNVFVTDPDRGWLWWIAADGEPSPGNEITPSRPES